MSFITASMAFIYRLVFCTPLQGFNGFPTRVYSLRIHRVYQTQQGRSSFARRSNALCTLLTLHD